MKDLRANQLWWYGPEWLGSSKENYPVQPSKSQLETEECYQEIRQELTILLAKNELKGNVNLDKILDVNKFSSYNRLLKCTALVLRCISNMKSRGTKKT